MDRQLPPCLSSTDEWLRLTFDRLGEILDRLNATQPGGPAQSPPDTPQGAPATAELVELTKPAVRRTRTRQGRPTK